MRRLRYFKQIRITLPGNINDPADMTSSSILTDYQILTRLTTAGP